MSAPHAQLLKEDGLGRVERIELAGRSWVRRVACGGRAPLSRVLARTLRRREERAIALLSGLADVPQAAPPELTAELARVPSADGRLPDPRDVTLRSWLPGEPLHRATHLPQDYFDELERLVRAVHARGVCHNDLHKEQNVLVLTSGRPALVDFQLASVHPDPNRPFATRVRDDLRHIRKHLRRYVRDGRGPAGLAERVQATPRPPRSALAAVWRRVGKPVYNVATRTIFPKDSEPRRESSGPWPTWGPAVGPRAADLSNGGESELHAPEPRLR